MKPKLQSGWTLIELLFVLALLAVIATLSTPALKQFWQQQQRKRDLAAIEQALSYTRQMAVVTGHSVRLCPYTKKSTCGSDWQQGFLVRDKQQIFRVFPPISKAAKLTWRGFRSNDHIDFNASVIATVNNGRFEYTSASSGKVKDVIVLNRAGLHRLQSG